MTASTTPDDREPLIEAVAETPSQPPTKVAIMLGGDSVRPWLSLFAVAFMLWLLITYGGLLAEVLAVVFGAYLLNLAIRPLAMRLAKARIPPSVTVIIVYLGIISVLALLIHFTLPTILSEISTVNQALPHLLAGLETRLDSVPILNQVQLTPTTLAENTEEQLPTVASTAVNIAGEIAHIVIDLTLVLVLAYIFVTDRSLGPDLLFTWVPKNRRWRVRTVFANTSERLTRWLMAQIVIASFFAIMFGLGLWLLGVPLAATIAVIGGVLEFVPFLGGAVSLTLASLVALTSNSPLTVVGVVVLYFVVNLIQVQVIQPLMYSRAVHAHPAAILIALLVGAQAGGVLGALFAVPVAVVGLTLLDEMEKPGEAPAEAPAPPKLPGEVGSAPASD